MEKQPLQQKKSPLKKDDHNRQNESNSTGVAIPGDQTSTHIEEKNSPAEESGLNVLHTSAENITPTSNSSIVTVLSDLGTTDLNFEVPTEVLQTAQLLTEFSSQPAAASSDLQDHIQFTNSAYQHEPNQTVESLLQSHSKQVVIVNPGRSSVETTTGIATESNSLNDANRQTVFIINNDGTMSTARRWGTYLCESNGESSTENDALPQPNVVVVTNPGAEQHNADGTPTTATTTTSIQQNFSNLTKLLVPVDSVVLRNIAPKSESNEEDSIAHQVDQANHITDGNVKELVQVSDPHLLPPPPGPILFQVMKDDGTVQSVNINPVDQLQEQTESSATAADPGGQIVYEPKKPFKCELCSASFTLLGNLNRHRMIHSINAKEECRFKCNECGRFFLQRCDLIRHTDIHNKTEPYKCEICGKGYIRRSDLVVHTRFHKREKHCQCTYCGKTYYQSGDLNRHIRSVHLQYKMLTCGHCKKKFTKEATLMRHMQANHRDIILQSVDQLSTQTDRSEHENSVSEPDDCPITEDTDAQSKMEQSSQ
ncbi:early growth response protein 1 [Lingula anatina]|uniref:Early growth response protein 1 n=1 Tax=Lingula anatina TaxID=7574 RepID=A0A1S3JUI5_LINAN|nr:early growth response protein 1 [Lingula anatina]|eukprot:XP_013413982.1 early growth response protein 1 [Lingula anatina]